MRKTVVGLIGCGAIGNGLAAAIQQRLPSNLRLAYVHDLIPAHCEDLCARHDVKARQASFEELIDRSDYIIEAASAEISGRVAVDALLHDKTVQIMSVGGLLPWHSQIRSMAESTRGRLLIPSGALAGIDAIKTAREGRIDVVRLTTTKPPAALAGAPFFEQNDVDIESIDQPIVLFEGTVFEAVRYFPKNINVAATLGFAVGDPDLVTVKIIASPAATRNIHEVVVDGDFGKITTRTENEPSAANPRTSALAVRSAYAILAKWFDHVDVGT